MHNPWDGHWPLVCDWACHLARGSAGGDDYAMVVGTPVTAAFSGTLRGVYDASQNLNKAELTSDEDPLLSFYHLHVSRFAPDGHYNEGDVIAWSGGAPGAHGSGTATGPHLHVNAFYAGQIEDFHKYLTTTAGEDIEKITIEPKENEMKLVQHPNGQLALVGETTFLQISVYTANSLVPVWGAWVPVTEDAWTFMHQTAQLAGAARAA